MYGTILHLDQGFQYPSHAYNKWLSDLGIIGSHSHKGNCHDNACIESFFSHFKSEMLYLNCFKTEEDFIQVIEEYIYFYNYKRFWKRSTKLRWDYLYNTNWNSWILYVECWERILWKKEWRSIGQLKDFWFIACV